MNPESLWKLSCRAYQRGHIRTARILKLLNYVAFHAILPYESQLEGSVQLWHRGLGVVIHPNTRFVGRVQIAHGVTIASGDWQADGSVGVDVHDGVMIGAGAFISSKKGSILTIGAGSRVGANATVTSSVPPGATVVGPVATVVAPTGEPA